MELHDYTTTNLTEGSVTGIVEKIEKFIEAKINRIDIFIHTHKQVKGFVYAEDMDSFEFVSQEGKITCYIPETV